MEITEVALGDIEVGDRFRQDYDLTEDFLGSIREKGIVQAITIDQNMNLVCGGRRLAGCKKLEMVSIPALMRQTDGELDLRECEYIENAFRKDLSWTERNANVARIHALVVEKFGEKRGNIRRVTELVNRSSGGVVRCLQMHKEVSSYPILATIKTEDEAVKILRQLKEKVAAMELVKEHTERVAEFHEEEKGESNHEYSDNIKLAMYADSHFNIGDCFDGMQEMIDNKLCPPVCFAEVDPPYAIDLKDVKKGDGSKELDIYEEIKKEDYPNFLERLCDYLYKVTPRDTRICFWFGIEWIEVVKESLSNAGFKVDSIPHIWSKSAGQTNAPELYLARAWEPFFIAWKGEGIPIRQRGRINVFNFPVVPASRKYHPTQRPVELMQEILRTFAWEGSIIMVPFLGSGATLRAAYKEGINGFGWELNEENKEKFLAAVEADIQDELGDTQDRELKRMENENC